MQKKIITFIILNVLVISATLGVISYIEINNNLKLSMQNRLALARVIANHIQVILNSNLNRLHDVSLLGRINMKDNDWRTRRRILQTLYEYSLFTEGVFLLDEHGNEVLTYPDYGHFPNLTYINDVNRVLQTGRPVISDIYTLEPIKKKVIFMMAPLKDNDGRVTGVIGGMLGPAEPYISTLLQSSRIGGNSYIEVIDSKGTIVASDDPMRVFLKHNYDGIPVGMIRDGESGIRQYRRGYHPAGAAQEPDNVLAIVPLSVARWAVIVGEPKGELFAPAAALRRKFTMLVVVFILTAVFFSIVTSRHIVRPLKSLISSTNRIASGDLRTPVGRLGSDEILVLSRSFDAMREKLADSLERIRTHSVQLENRVAKRTRQIRESKQRIEHLLRKVISSQEDERKRIARGIHDTILQDVSAFLIKLDICKLQPEKITVVKIDEMREIVMKTIDNVHAVIKDLRPSILDDFGIDAAIMWLMKKHFTEKKINYDLYASPPVGKRLPPRIETTLFRIMQECIINIARHSNATNVFVMMIAGETFMEILIEDDGGGFAFQELMDNPAEDGRGLGILGMRERASLLDGSLQICSLLGEGTWVCVHIPLKAEVENVQDTCVNR